MILPLSGNRLLKIGLVFEAPDKDVVAMTADPEVRAQALASGDGGGDLDRAMGLGVTPIAQLTVFRSDGTVESSVFMTEDQLRFLLYEGRAVAKNMVRLAETVDHDWKGFRNLVRSRALGDDDGRVPGESGDEAGS